MGHHSSLKVVPSLLVSFESKNTGNLGVSDLAEGGIGRITLYTEQAIKDLGEKLK